MIPDDRSIPPMTTTLLHSPGAKAPFVPPIKCAEVSRAIGLSFSVVRLLMSTQQIKSIKVGKFWRTTWDEVKAYLERNSTSGPGVPVIPHAAHVHAITDYTPARF